MPTGDLTQIKQQSQIDATDFVLEVKDSPEFEAVLAARALVSEQRWADYDLYQFAGLQEQLLYEKALVELKRLWTTNRPSYWGKHYRDRSEEYEETTEQEGTGENPA